MNNFDQHILLISPYSPSEDKIAQYSATLFDVFNKKINTPFKLKICAVTSENFTYDNYKEVQYVLNPLKRQEYFNLADNINKDGQISSVLIQHNINLYGRENGDNLLFLLYSVKKPILLFLNEVPEKADYRFKELLKSITSRANVILVGNKFHKEILINQYEIICDKIELVNEKINFDENLIGVTANNFTSISIDKEALIYADLFLRYSVNKNIEFTVPPLSLEILRKALDYEQNKKHTISENSILHNSEVIHAICLYHKLTNVVYGLKVIELLLMEINDCICKNMEHINMHKSLEGKEEKDMVSAFSAMAILLSIKDDKIPVQLYSQAKTNYQNILKLSETFTSFSAHAGLLKGLYIYYTIFPEERIKENALIIADKLIEKYYQEVQIEEEQKWIENSYHSANSKLSEALLYAYLLSGVEIYKVIAIVTFDWIIANSFREGYLNCVSNTTFGTSKNYFDYKPAEVTETIITLSLFYEVFDDDLYLRYIKTAFNWYSGYNNIKTAIHYPEFDICFDGISENKLLPSISDFAAINYLIARLVLDLKNNKKNLLKTNIENETEILNQ
ncbi:MAG: hypothetical protein H0V01_05885 [Bacteroidetes bacterium]|nr:hypothetical protein [Bacteroidota bacterium]HET6244321.1 hypothetical protein [Bacteroidia bacterium]